MNLDDVKAKQREKKKERKKRFRPDNRRSIRLIQELLKGSGGKRRKR